jgi:hypothetical protein
MIQVSRFLESGFEIQLILPNDFNLITKVNSDCLLYNFLVNLYEEVPKCFIEDNILRITFHK